MVLVAGDERKVMQERRRRDEEIGIGDQLPSPPKRAVELRRSVDDLFSHRIDDACPAPGEEDGDLPSSILRVEAAEDLVASDDRELEDAVLLQVLSGVVKDLRITPLHDLGEGVRVEEGGRVRCRQGSREKRLRSRAIDSTSMTSASESPS